MCAKGGIEILFKEVLAKYRETENALNGEMVGSVEEENRLNQETEEKIQSWKAELKRLLFKSYYAVPSEFEGDRYDREEFIEKYGVSGYALDWAIVDEDGTFVAATGTPKIPSKFNEEFAMDEDEKDQIVATHFGGNPFPG